MTENRAEDFGTSENVFDGQANDGQTVSLDAAGPVGDEATQDTFENEDDE